ncbi:NUDIX domain-containing protein [Chromobacterium sphagni]|uniref:NUDIX hydrolase n=1 Tax=Chromobacterium sphagni TaxID=1903179 RepID=A0ABX3CEP5_9NEIS|nr:NUDIX domain-containing protein [Chromobacterium sphagni]OHX20462.1 NUDIX hydrolase [Chromobacterium sphagni]
MAFDDCFRLSAHVVITDAAGAVLLLKATYGSLDWGLPGGALEPGETIHECIARECREELGCDVAVAYLSGVYYHRAYNSQAFIFRCSLPDHAALRLSDEHSAFRYFALDELGRVQRRRVDDCLSFQGVVASVCF